MGERNGDGVGQEVSRRALLNHTKAQKLEVPCAPKALLHPEEGMLISAEMKSEYVNLRCKLG